MLHIKRCTREICRGNMYPVFSNEDTGQDTITVQSWRCYMCDRVEKDGEPYDMRDLVRLLGNQLFTTARDLFREIPRQQRP